MLRKKTHSIMTKIFSSKLNTILFVVPIFYFINLNYLLKGGLIYDDFSLSINHIDFSIFKKIKINCLLYFNTRPIGGIYVALISEFKANYFGYIFLNISLWLATGIIIYLSIYKHFNQRSSLIFLFVFLFPSFASTPFFSPVTQSLGVFSLFLWSISIFFSVEKKIYLSVFFFILSLLTYEYTVVLFLINIILYLNQNKQKIENLQKIKITFIKVFSLFAIGICMIIIFQFLIADVTNNSDPLKYAIRIVDNKLVFEDDFFNNILKYSTKPLEIITIEIPKLLSSSLFFIKFNIYNLFIYIIFLVVLFNIIFFNKITLNKNIIFIKLFLSVILISSIFVFFMYLIVSSVPTVKGYYNRGLVGLFVCFCFFICLISELKFKSILYENIKFIILAIIIILNFNSFLIQKNNYTKSEEIRSNILDKLKNFSNEKNKKSYVLMIVPTYLRENYNNETIFSEEVMDLHFAARYITNKKISAIRVFNDKKCERIFKNDQNQIVGYVPSRNKKITQKVKIHMMSKVDFDNLYFYYKGKFLKLSNNNDINYNLISKHLKCTF